MTNRVGETAPLQCQQQTHYARGEQRSAHDVELRQFLLGRDLGGVSIRDIEEEEDEDHRSASERQIDVEAPAYTLEPLQRESQHRSILPSPSQIAGEDSAKKRPEDGSNAEDGTKKTLIQRSLVKWNRVGDDDELCTLCQRRKQANTGSGG